MPNGFPAYPKGRFPNEHPPTLFHPASPKMRPVKQADDTASMASTSTFSSTVSLLKSKMPVSYKEHKARKEAKIAARSTVVTGSEPEKESSKRKPLPKDPKTPRQRTAEAYMAHAMLR